MRKKGYTVGFAISEINEGVSQEEVRQVFGELGLPNRTVRPGDAIEELLLTLIGKPYVKGASVSKDAPEAFDCSSLAAYVYVQAGFALPRVSVDQYAFTSRIQESELVLGDLVFSNTGVGKIYMETFEYKPGTPVPEGIDHVGIYTGDGEVVHATELVGEVVRERLSESPRFTNIVGCGRVIESLTEERFVVEIPENMTEFWKPGALLLKLRKELRK